MKLVGWRSIVFSVAAIGGSEALAFDSSMQMSGTGFVEACTRADESWISFCNGYIQAAVDNLREGDGICFPAGTSRTDLVTITEREISASPNLQALNAQEAVRLVLQRAYPC
jgi:hypothetical protein